MLIKFWEIISRLADLSVIIVLIKIFMLKKETVYNPYILRTIYGADAYNLLDYNTTAISLYGEKCENMLINLEDFSDTADNFSNKEYVLLKSQYNPIKNIKIYKLEYNIILNDFEKSLIKKIDLIEPNYNFIIETYLPEGIPSYSLEFMENNVYYECDLHFGLQSNTTIYGRRNILGILL